MVAHVDLVDDIGMPRRFTPYTTALMMVLSLTWVLACTPTMVPAYVTPTPTENAAAANATFWSVTDEWSLSEGDALYTTQVYFFGSLLLGQIPCAMSDRIGRKVVAFWTALLTGVAGVIAGIAPNYTIFLIGRFLQGVFFSATTNINWVMTCEGIALSLHGKASFVYGVMWCMGYVIVAPLAMIGGTWRFVFLATALPTIAYAFVLKYTIPESLSFLIDRRREDAVDAWIARDEAWGAPKVDPARRKAYFAKLDSRPEREQNEWELTKDAFKDRKTLIYLLISIYMWVTDFLVYNGLSLTSKGIEVGDPDMNYVLSGLVELPAAFSLPILMDWLGRRPTVILSHAVTAIALAALAYIPLEWTVLYIGVWMVAKCATAASFVSLYVYGSEIFEIRFRSICLGIASTLGNIGAMAAPATANLGATNHVLVYLIYAGVSLVSCFLDIYLPETKYKARVAPQSAPARP